ncbi:UNVERIFIED_ORG: hypothetical protein M2438_002771 [Methylobacterium sp. SuP10 SLI 274]|nr:hypothetical protein [Methylorubrum extorquens]MDF9864003.1 hypothetical protein [Methylorubrum pseudosasae]MDH6637596.1 hypothetical protein [Methylobacterium sp. SuP10 SLI 274]MDH6666775.1 hypothetical protein [Methylorubrum zatmanii]
MVDGGTARLASINVERIEGANLDNCIVLSTVPPNFRSGDAPCFKDLSDIIYSYKDTYHCPISDIIENSADFTQYARNKYGSAVGGIVVFESMLDENARHHLKDCGVKILLITEDLHLTSLSNLSEAVRHSDLVLSRFDIINDLIGDQGTEIIPFLLHCADFLVSDPVEPDAESIVHFGQLLCNPPNIDMSKLSGRANQYAFREKWHGKFTESGIGIYNYLKTSPDKLLDEVRKHSIGFACTYFPYSFSQLCRDEQGLGWARENTPIKFDESYMVAKLFEIPGSGLLLLADPTGLKRHLTNAGFIDRSNYIAITEETFDEVISFIMDKNNKQTLSTIRKNGNQLVRSYHLKANRAAQFGTIMDKFLGGSK